jgi:mannan polymerase II complex MNN10 subunit
MRNHNVNGYPSFSTQNSGFFVRHMRRISSSLPRFGDSPYSQKEKLGRGRWADRNVPLLARMRSIFRRMGRKLKLRLLIALILSLIVLLYYTSRESSSKLPGHSRLTTTITSITILLATIIRGR